jgi:hypothetical protein
MGKYESYYSVPLITPSWTVLAQTTSVRSAHYALKDQARAVWDPAARVVRVTSPTAGQLQVTGMQAPKRTTYGSSMISTVTLKAGATAAWTARPLP